MAKTISFKEFREVITKGREQMAKDAIPWRKSATEDTRFVARTLEDELLNISLATDGRGLRVNLLSAHSPPIPRDFRKAIDDLLCFEIADAKWLDQHGEMATARNLELLARGWQACLAYHDKGETR